MAHDLDREVDAWLRGDRSRRRALKEALAAAGLIAATSVLGARPAAATVEMADPATPLGQAQAAALRASTEGPVDGSAYRAVQAAKKLGGVTLNITAESGLQALEPRNFSGPLWNQLTGATVQVNELPHPDQYSKPIAEHIANSGAYDVLDIEPAWIPALADGGVIAPIDDMVAKHMNAADLEDYHPLYRTLPTYKGKRWGFFDDGDQLMLYYRRDVFEDPKLRAAYKQTFNRELAPPKTWDEFNETAEFISAQMAPAVYGAAHFRKAGAPGNQFAFLQQFRANGGRFFDDQSMAAQLASPAGETTFKQMLRANKAAIPGNDELDAVTLWVAWLQGKVAMMFSWPPTGRMSENYSQRDKAINFVPQSAIAGKVGYAVMPGGNGEMASGYVTAIAADSANLEAAYLYAQWLTSPPVSLVRVMLPYTLRDPYRLSHYRSPLYRQLWPGAKDYLVALSDAANDGVVDMIMPGWQDYALAVDRMCTGVWAGQDPKAALAACNAEWDATTKKLGLDQQRAAYSEFRKLAGSYADNTVSKLGRAVHLD